MKTFIPRVNKPQKTNKPFFTPQIVSQSVTTDVIQRQCSGNIQTPSNGYASNAAPQRRCDEENTGFSDITERITNARRSAKRMIGSAIEVLTQMVQGSASSDAQNHFRRSFGLSSNPNPSQIQSVLNIFNSMCQWISSESGNNGNGFICLNPRSLRCRTIAGSAVCNSRRPMNICPNQSDLAGTIVHELAHRYGICTTTVRNELYEGNRNFPSRNAIRTSADSYRIFARDIHNLSVEERLRDSSGRSEREIFVPRGLNLE